MPAKRDEADKVDADRLRKFLKAHVDKMCEETGVTYASISRQCGKKQQYLSEYFKRGRPDYFPEVFRHHFAKITGIDEEILKPPELRGLTVQSPVTANVRRSGDPPWVTGHSVRLRDAVTDLKLAAERLIEALDALENKL
jgi:hypothetical protein